MSDAIAAAYAMCALSMIIGVLIGWARAIGENRKRWLEAQAEVERLRFKARCVEAVRDLTVVMPGTVSVEVLGTLDCPSMNPHHYYEAGCPSCAESHLVKVGELLDDLIKKGRES